MTYLLQVSTCWIVFYGIYFLFLKKETFFSINRYYLMGALVAGLLVPYLGAFMPANEASVEVYQVMTQYTAVEVLPEAFIEEAAPIFTWINILWSVYILGGIVVLSRFIYGLNRIFNIYKGADKTTQLNYTLVESEKYHLPFSFFHFIFISKQLPLNEEIEKVLQHEELHANQWHSLDIVFTELLQIFFWFNPILIFYKNALRQSHEYLADAYVTQGHNKNSYGQLLLRQSISGLEIALANQFFHSQIKKRITMMYKEKSKRSAMVKYLAAFPVLLVMIIIFSSNQTGEQEAENSLTGQEQVYSSLENEFRDKLMAKGIDPENINHEDPTHLKAIEKTLNEITKISFDFDIRIEKNGVYTFPPTNKEHADISEYFKAIKVENRPVVLKVHSKAPASAIASVLDCASKNDVKVHVETIKDIDLSLRKDLVKSSKDLFGTKPMLKNQNKVEDWDQITILSNGAYAQDHTPLTNKEVIQIIEFIKEAGVLLKVKAIEGVEWDKVHNLLELAAEFGVKTKIVDVVIPINFDGRKIIQRNWKALFSKFPSLDGLITISAEANADGDIIYAEVIKEKTTIDNIVILKDALKAAKGYKIEEGSKNATGEIVFNFSRSTPQQGFTYHENIDVFNFDSEINLGDQIPEGTVAVKVDGILLQEYVDYKIDYLKGKLIMLDSYNKELPVNVTFKENQTDPIFKVVEEMPRFPGCEDMDGTAKEKEECAKQKMLEFIYSNLKYPAKARGASVEGMCVVQFVVEKDGSVSGSKLVRDIGADCGVETIKVVNSFPTWIPGKQKGNNVRVQYTLPVKFKLQGPEVKEEEIVNVVGFGEINQTAKKENLTIKTESELNGDVLKVSQEMPRFSGCEDIQGTAKEKEECAKHKMLEYVYRNIKYPKEARAKGIDGMSVIRMVIEKDGSVTNVITLRDPGAGTGAEAARIVREMPTWIPGKQNGKTVRVQYTLPVKFKLEEDDKPSNIEKLLKGNTAGVSISEDSDRKIRLNSSNHNGPNPLFVINGKIKENASAGSLNPDDIESMIVLKGEKAIEKYGKDGANGAVEITMKLTNGVIQSKSKDLKPIKFSISPNPSSGNFNIEYQLDKNVPANLTFFSIDGKTIKRMLNLPAENKISVDFSNQNVSVIYITLEQDGKSQTRKASIHK